MQDKHPLKFTYIFKFTDGNSASFEVLLDPDTLDCVRKPSDKPPDWARLIYYKCDNCPLDEDLHEYCPIASNIGTLVDAFRDVAGYETAHVLVMTKQRDMSKTTTITEALSSLLGLYMVTSGCPVMEKLKPLVRYHLPFATLEETVVRTASMYLLIQYFLKKNRQHPDWDLELLEKIYEDVRLVNASFSKRLSHAAEKDASLSALDKLDMSASLLPLVITDTLDAIGKSLSAYTKW